MNLNLPKEWRPIPVIAAFLASAGLPIYIHFPRFAAELGFGLGAIGALLLGLRLLDFLQDPLLGVMVDRMPNRRRALAMAAFLCMGLGFLIVFVLQPGLFGLSAGMILVFSAFSLGTILFYGQATDLIGAGAPQDHYRLAGFRESGALVGIILAAILPSLLVAFFGGLLGYRLFGGFLAVFAFGVWWYGRGFWRPVAPQKHDKAALATLFGPKIRPLLGIAFVNALPVAITSTLFLFFVEDRLNLPALAGAYLVLFFVAAGVSAPLWSRLAARFGARRVLLPAMGMSIAAFIGVALLPAGSAWAFGAITLASGAALGADMVVLPALFSSRLSQEKVPVGIAFGLWTFAAKFSLAVAAGVVLPLLNAAGYVPGASMHSPEALQALTLLYAVLPCGLKLLAMVLVFRLPDEGLGETR